MKKILINIFFICSILAIIIWFVIKQYEESKIPTKSSSEVYTAETTITEETKKYEEANVIKEYEGYTGIAKLEIPKISLETYILADYSEDALDTSVTKLYGANPNEIGNCCIAGHNNNNGAMFSNLSKLEIGDTFFLSDNETGKVEYEIYDIYKVSPDDTTCLSQETNGKRIVTLITCTNDAKMRIIVKAQET